MAATPALVAGRLALARETSWMVPLERFTLNRSLTPGALSVNPNSEASDDWKTAAVPSALRPSRETAAPALAVALPLE